MARPPSSPLSGIRRDIPGFDDAGSRTIDGPHFARRSPDGSPGQAPIERNPSRVYVLVVISLAVFMIGLTFFCRPAVRHTIVGEVSVVASPGVDAGGHRDGRRTLPTLLELANDRDAWQRIGRQLEYKLSELPTFTEVASGSSEGGLPRLRIAVEDSQPELAVRWTNRYLQDLVERFEQSQLGTVDPAALAMAEQQVEMARQERDQVRARLDAVTERLTRTDSEQASSAEHDSPADQEHAAELAELRRLEALMVEASRGMDAAVDLHRELRHRMESGSGLHLVIARPGRLASRRAEPFQAWHLMWLGPTALVCGMLAALASPRAKRDSLLRTVEQVEAISPYPVIVMRRDSRQQELIVPHHLPRPRRRAHWVRRAVRTGELTLFIALTLAVGYGAATEGYAHRMMADPLGAYGEASAVVWQYVAGR